MPRSLLGDLMLLFVTLCWGITFPLLENAVKEVSPAVFVTVRFFLAALILIPFIFSSFAKNNKQVLKAGIVLGLINTGAYLTQTIGMETVSSAQGAFITGMFVVIVPFLLPFFKLGLPSKIDIICALSCVFGLFLLTGGGFAAANIGELWVLCCAGLTAISLVYLQKVSSQLKNLNLLAFFQILFTGLFSSVFSIGQNYSNIFNMNALIALLFCATFATSVALTLQTKFQRYTTASRAAMIFCLEPVFASLFGYVINGEKLNHMAMVGGLIILLSIVASELYRAIIPTIKEPAY